MRLLATAALVCLPALAACSSMPRPLVPATSQGPATYVCYSSTASAPVEVRAVADQECARYGLKVSSLIGQRWTPMRCGVLTPTVAAFQCGRPEAVPVGLSAVEVVPSAQ
ncbi:MAG: hypothetical protein ACM33T_07870 [Solirubrobacterales bacterium]